jgi:hypothetical protein
MHFLMYTGTGEDVGMTSEVWAGVFTHFKALRSLRLSTDRITQASAADTAHTYRVCTAACDIRHVRQRLLIPRRACMMTWRR